MLLCCPLSVWRTDGVIRADSIEGLGYSTAVGGVFPKARHVVEVDHIQHFDAPHQAPTTHNEKGTYGVSSYSSCQERHKGYTNVNNTHQVVR